MAIDNKIEQAMDLVKSHLMFAVREEVEVLKEKIAELMERIAFLESENSILRAAASQVSHLSLHSDCSRDVNCKGSGCRYRHAKSRCSFVGHRRIRQVDQWLELVTKSRGFSRGICARCSIGRWRDETSNFHSLPVGAVFVGCWPRSCE